MYGRVSLYLYFSEWMFGFSAEPEAERVTDQASGASVRFSFSLVNATHISCALLWAFPGERQQKTRYAGERAGFEVL